MAFFQTPPELGNQFTSDRVLRSYLARVLGKDALATAATELDELGELSGGELYRMQLADRTNEPRLVSWDPWGNRVDEIEVTPLWKRAQVIAAEKGVVATGYDKSLGDKARVHQFARVYLFDGSTDVYTCPLAMTDGAAATLTHHGGPIAERALAHLLSRDPKEMWTSGQWMTERTGGSDVGLTETVAKPMDDGSGRYRLYGTKWFTSATTSQMALTLGRPEGNPDGGRGLALFFVEVRGEDGKMNGIQINRLKDKLGTRKVPTAELTLDGTIATPLAGTTDGIRQITPMLNVTRTWNSVCSLSAMRRAIALARDYANKRVQFGAKLADKPLHTDTLAGMQAELEAAFCFVFKGVELLGKLEAKTATKREAIALRLFTPLMKLTTGKQAVAVVSEALECFGGAGYIEDTGLPRLLRDAQVLSIWEGTTNVLSLDTLRAIAKEGALAPFIEEMAAATKSAAPELEAEANAAMAAATHAASWLEKTFAKDALSVEAGARRFALTLGRAAELAYLVEHASWCLANENDRRPLLAAKRFLKNRIDLVEDDSMDSRALAMDA
ncbi:MAG TPA: acyl-CoA dehydrogenase family protein [Polyangiaceae bacterium]|nr:acyl-CoA dehydrogenase family protein [Polyangiaceae bacterium]